ncbi:STAS domain-containing protein [Acidihalobacter prosperus]
MTATVHVTHKGGSRYSISGSMTSETIPALWSDLQKRVLDVPDLEFSLEEVVRADSAGVACLVACMRGSKTPIRFTNLPDSMRVIIDVSDLNELFNPPIEAS